MRYGIFSDIHSNLEALEAVIKAYQKEKIDKYLCLGDVVGYGANPNECVEIVSNLASTTVAGNHDWAAIDLFSVELFNEEAKFAVLWTGRQLSSASRDFLRSLKLVSEMDNLVLAHGSLDAPRNFNYLLNVNSCLATFELMRRDICFVGHTHVPVVFIKDKDGKSSFADTDRIKITPGNKYIVNVGAVGQPRDSIPQAAYCIWDSETQEVQIKRAVYDVFLARQKIIDKGLPEFLGNRLLTGN
jgi:putative phosphoesterase